MSRQPPGTAAARSALMLELDDAPGHLVRVAQQRHTQLWSDEFDGTLTGPQYAVLCAAAADGSSTQRALGERASLDTSSMSDLVARLASQGWLRLDRDPADGRRKSVALTLPARAALPDITRRAALVQERLLEPVPAQRRPGFLEVMRMAAYHGGLPEPEAVDVGLRLQNTPGHLIRRTQQVHTALWSAEVGNRMTAPQYAVLSALWARPEGLDQTAAGQLAALDKSSMADVVSRLARRGFISRTRDLPDGRYQLLRLTAAVRADLPDITAGVRRVQDAVLAPLIRPRQRDLFLAGYRAIAGSPERPVQGDQRSPTRSGPPGGGGP